MRLDTLDYQTGDSPKSCIIILHGLGASATDFVPVARQWNLRALGDVRYVFPFAPEQPVTINGGMRMPAWYDILGLDLVRREDEKSLRASAVALQALIDREIAGGIPASRIVLAGFSQGCAMTLLTGLRAPQRLAGLLGMSGYLPLAATTAAERSAANRDTPIFLAHGRMDPVVPFERGTATRDALVALGHPVEWHDYPMQHSVSEQEIEDTQAWLLKVLA
ncbi:MAG TPA: carboxylesterase [Burkholderiaceae bacterium]|jgi:phospholipase/carboxylesterase|nr:carboxylesterase [Burkholderiaceae bacterium]